MFKSLLPLLIVFVSSLSWAQTLPAVGFHSPTFDTLPEIYREPSFEVGSSMALVLVREKDSGNVHSSGSGYVVAPGNILHTSHHVVQNALEDSRLEVLIRFEDGNEEILGRILRQDLTRDFIEFELSKNREKFLNPGSNSVVDPGDLLLLAGYPFGLKLRVSMGYGLESTSAGQFLTSASSLPGMSGGPAILISKDGKLKNVVGFVKSTDRYRELGNTQAFLTHIPSLDLLNRNFKYFSSIPELKNKASVRETASGEWLSANFDESWENANTAPPLILPVTFHNIHASLTDLEQERTFELLREKKQEWDELAKKISSLFYPRALIRSKAHKLNKELLRQMILQNTGVSVPISIPVYKDQTLKEILGLPDDDLLKEFQEHSKNLSLALGQAQDEYRRAKDRYQIYSNTSDLLKILVKASENKESFFDKEELNRYFWRTPAIISLIP